MALAPNDPEVTKRIGYAIIPTRTRPNEEYPQLSQMLKSNVLQPVQIVGSTTGATTIHSGTKAVLATASRLRGSSLAVKTLTIKLRALGATATYVSVGGPGGQEFRLTSVGDAVDLDVDPYEVYVISDSAVTPVLEWLATV